MADTPGTQPTARSAARADVPGVAAALARAFHDDPVTSWLLCHDPRRREARLRRFFAAEARRYLNRDGVWAAEVDGAGINGAALWAPPGRWRETWLELLRGSPVLVPVLNWRVPRGLRLVTAMERAHPREPHWYLGLLGTEPAAQGRGVGTALMRPILERCDREGMGAYLESSKDSNIPYYERSGFRVTGEIRLRGGPTMWPMWRDPGPPPEGPG